jgi:hypothetical protein
MKYKSLSITFVIIILLIIGTTFVLYLGKNDNPHTPPAPAKEIPEMVASGTATTSETRASDAASEAVVEELTTDKGELIEVKRLGNGVTQEVRKEIAIQRWGHSSGVVATLYRKDEFYDADGNQNHSFTLRAVNKEGKEYTLYSFVPDVERLFSSRSVNSVEFSPLGTYLVLDESRYESSWTRFYDLRDGSEIVKKDEYGSFLLRGASPYWNANESRLLLLSNSNEMGGCMDCGTIKYSKTGGFDDLVTIVDLVDRYVEFGDVTINERVATFPVTERPFDEAGSHEVPATTTFDLETGILRSELSYLNN